MNGRVRLTVRLASETLRCEAGEGMEQSMKLFGAKVKRCFFHLGTSLDPFDAESQIVGLRHPRIRFVRVSQSDEI
jgi:hypothetical protein